MMTDPHSGSWVGQGFFMAAVALVFSDHYNLSSLDAPVLRTMKLLTSVCLKLGSWAVGTKASFSPKVYCWGSQCFLSVSALAGMLCPPRWSCLSLGWGHHIDAKCFKDKKRKHNS